MRMTRQISEFGPSAGLSIMTSFSPQFDPTVRRGARAGTEIARSPRTYWNMNVCYYMRIPGAGVRRTAYALHARNLRLRRLHLGYASVPMSCIGILYHKCILYSVFVCKRTYRAPQPALHSTPSQPAHTRLNCLGVLHVRQPHRAGASNEPGSSTGS